MTIPVGFLHHTREAASRAGREARPDSMLVPRPQTLVPAVIEEVQDFGYKVGVYGDDGEIIESIEGVLAFPEADLQPDTPVWLYYPQGQVRRPLILVSGGGGGDCGGDPYVFGVLMR